MSEPIEPTTTRIYGGGPQRIYRFENGYGASVISNVYSYGGTSGMMELAVLKYDDAGEWHLTYETPVTDDVLGHLAEPEVQDLLAKIRALPSA